MAPAEGYVRIPRKLAKSNVASERVAALLWVVAQASYAPREVEGVTLGIGETPCIPASRFEVRFRWTRKAVRVFLDWMVSERCTEETGLRIRVGQKWKGPAEGPGLGPAQGPTYLVHLAKVSTHSGPAEGPGLGPAQGPPEEKKVEKKVITSLPTGERRARGSRKIPKDWQPTPAEESELRSIAAQRGADYGAEMVMLRDHEFPRTYTDWAAVARNWMRRAAAAVHTTNGNGKRRDGEDWRVRREGDGRGVEDDPAFNFPLPDGF